MTSIPVLPAERRHFTMHVLLGDVILTQPDAYEQISFKVA